MDSQQKYLGSVPEDIEDVLSLIEKSFNIRFEVHELESIRTFGQLTDYIISNIKLDNKDDCTDQHAFYTIRKAISGMGNIPKSTMGPKTPLTYIFPRKTRRKKIKKVEKLLGLELKVLRPRHFVTNSLLIILVLSVIACFLNWQVGCAALFLSISGLWISDETGKEFKVKTLGALTVRMTQLNYVKSRRQLGTMNAREIHGKIEKLFVDELALNKRTIDRDTAVA